MPRFTSYDDDLQIPLQFIPLRRLPNQKQHMFHDLLGRRYMPTRKRALAAMANGSSEHSFGRHRELDVAVLLGVVDERHRERGLHRRFAGGGWGEEE